MIEKLKPTQPPFNMEYLVNELGCLETVKKILLRYSRHTNSQIEKLKQAITDNHIPEIHRIAHSIKGGAMNIRAGQLSEKALSLEKSAKTNKLDMAENQFTDILDAFNDVDYYIIKITREN